MATRPGIADLNGDHIISQLAREHWYPTSAPKQQPTKPLAEVVAKLWKAVEDEGFSTFSISLLEQLQALDRYLWPGYTDNASDQHVLLLVLLVNARRQEQVSIWSNFTNTPDEFASFFSRSIHLTIEKSLATPLRSHLLSFTIGAFQSLEHSIIRKECAPLVSIGIWQNLHSESYRDQLVLKNAQSQKAWRAAGKKYDNADAEGQDRLKFERSWLYSLLQDFLDKLYSSDAGTDRRKEDILYCERLVELLCDLQSQLPTRRYVNTLIQDLNLLPAIVLSPMYQDEDMLKDMYKLLSHYTYFPIEDQTGRQLSRHEYGEANTAKITRLQRVSMKLQPEKLKILVLTNYGSLSRREDLQSHLEALTDIELEELCHGMGIRTTQYPEDSLLVQDRIFRTETLLSSVEQKLFYADDMRQLSILPTETTLYDPGMLRTDEYNGSRPLALPKLNLQYLTMGDFLWRSYMLYRYEAFYAIRKHLEDTIKRLQPQRSQVANTRFTGFSRLAIPIAKPAIIEVVPPQVGEVTPAEVKAEIILDVSRLQPGLRREWESLKPDDTVFLLAVQPEDTAMKLTNGHGKHTPADQIGLKMLRCAEIINVLDENSRVLRKHQDAEGHGDGFSRPRQRRLLVKLDASMYKQDKERADASKTEVYQTINVIVRRKARENNFKPILETIRELALSDVPIPSWLNEVFLGYGDPTSATYKRLPNRLTSIDYRDTFLNWQHLVEALPGKTVEPDPTLDASFPPPYVLETTSAQPAPAPRSSKKRRRDQPDGPDAATSVETVKVSTYKPPNTGPYPTDAPKLNTIRFTPTQIDAVTSGTQPGLSVIVGPPGTGKTDVATQIISNIYHDFPQQRTLLIAHSNQALNQLFQKIVALDIDQRHLLRLGHGEEDLETEGSFSKAGRVDSFLERGGYYLTEVQRLAASIGAPGAHGNSCETADYFNQVHVEPAWNRYWETLKAGSSDRDLIVGSFPFHNFFSNVPSPLFPEDSSNEQLIEVAKGCERHINRIFEELADIRPFEILRAQRDKSNYLLVKEARIIAMTSTHAAIRRQEIANLGFHYDNVIMEEAAQVTEIENFIPFVLQSPQTENGKAPISQLKRIILVGDHLQNSPIIQNNALRSYANLEQSLFQRLIRLGVPHIMLDAQGRSRPSLAALCKWRYPDVTNLPFTFSTPAFQRANPGFRYEYQLINVPDYKSKGETEPTPHFIQNLGEAEFTVALYQYMRLLGYPSERITILTPYAGQRALIRDVLSHRCKGNRLFGLPRWVGTVDKYQGEQNDYVILSLVRTKSAGYLRDVRRLTVALSRARLGLYVLGRREVFEGTIEVKEAFEKLFERSNRLALVAGESFGNGDDGDMTMRGVEEAVEATEIEGVEHLGQYVYEMTKAKVAALKEGRERLPAAAVSGVAGEGGGRGEDEEDEDEDGDGDGLGDAGEDEDVELM